MNRLLMILLHGRSKALPRLRGRIVRAAVRKGWVLPGGHRPNPTSRVASVNFFTIVLNGMPFISHHLDTFSELKLDWKWHIVEGVASHSHDTAWSARTGGRIDGQFHRNGLSNDGTSEYIDDLRSRHPDRVVVYRKPRGQFWDGKVEMCNAVLGSVGSGTLLWQVDVDEFWTPSQIHTMVEMFNEQPERTAAWFFCRFFVGPRLAIASRGTYGNNPRFEWLRVWRFSPGMSWLAHEPPTLAIPTRIGPCDVGSLSPFWHAETEARGLIFDHLAYLNRGQLAFKEIYYGYQGAVNGWERLQARTEFPVPLRDYFGWISDDSTVRHLEDSEFAGSMAAALADPVSER